MIFEARGRARALLDLPLAAAPLAPRAVGETRAHVRLIGY